MKKIHYRTLDEDLSLILKVAEEKPKVTLAEVMEILSRKGRALLILFLSIPFCLPVQIPGMSVPFGIVIAFLGLRLGFNGKVWLPKTILRKEIESKSLKKMVEKSLKLVSKVKHLIHPRLEFLCENRIFLVIHGLSIFLLGLFLALPLPIPLTNQAAGWPIFILCLGILYRDGLFIVLGYVGLLIAIGFFLFLFLTLKNFFPLNTK